VQAHQCDALLVDLRGHGDSPALEPPHTIQACADDIRDIVPGLDLANIQRVVGHSLGGKVALAYCAQEPAVKQCVVLDSPPGVHVEVGGGDSATRLLSILPQLAVESKAQIVRDLQHVHGFSPMVANWMTTNLSGTRERPWVFDRATVQALFVSYAQLDLFASLETMPTDEVRFIRAEKNKAWTPDVLARFAALRNPRVKLVLARGCGHWLHAEKPAYVRALVDDDDAVAAAT